MWRPDPTVGEKVRQHFGYSEERWKKIGWKERRLHIAAYEIDVAKVHEEPKNSNWGPSPQKYLASVGISFPAAWCAAGLNWCTAHSDPPEGMKPKRASMAASWLRLFAKNRLTVKRGDIGGWINADGTGHVFLITAVRRNWKLQAVEFDTLEFNSNDEGSREGFEGCRRVRAWDAKTRVAA